MANTAETVQRRSLALKNMVCLSEGKFDKKQEKKTGFRPSKYCFSEKRVVLKTNFNKATIDKRDCDLDK